MTRWQNLDVIVCVDGGGENFTGIICGHITEFMGQEHWIVEPMTSTKLLDNEAFTCILVPDRNTLSRKDVT